jgi:hypothetical protein
VQTEVNKLVGKGAGLQKHLAQLAQGPCAETVAAYRLSGPLGHIVCGLHLDGGYRLAFTILPASVENGRPSIVVLYVGKRQLEGTRQGDVWEVLHDLFGVENPLTTIANRHAAGRESRR